MAALTCAFEITNAPGWQDEYDVTVYQLGWRLGGKGASGRNAEQLPAHRGARAPHLARVLRERVPRAQGRRTTSSAGPPGAPLATWQDAFKPHDYVVLMEQIAAALDAVGDELPAELRRAGHRRRAADAVGDDPDDPRLAQAAVRRLAAAARQPRGSRRGAREGGVARARTACSRSSTSCTTGCTRSEDDDRRRHRLAARLRHGRSRRSPRSRE